MDFNTQVTDEFIKQVCEGDAWGKANIKVARIEEATEEVAQVAEATEVVEIVEGDAEGVAEGDISFSLEDLEFVLDHLEDDALLEHASSMLDLFDAANEYLLNEGDEDEEEEEEEEAEAEEK